MALSRTSRLFVIAVALFSSAAPHAESTLPTGAAVIRAEEADIPRTTTQPEALGASGLPEVIRCERQFLWKGRTYECDSYFRRDGEGLRKIVGDVPNAVALLNSYQRVRRNVQIAAYTATSGLAVGGLAFLGSRLLFAPGDINAQSFRNIGIGAGLGIILASFVTAAVLQTSNERKLDEIVEVYNQARPDSPLILQFTTEFQLQ